MADNSERPVLSHSPLERFKILLELAKGELIGARKALRPPENDIRMVTGDEALELIAKDETCAVYDDQLFKGRIKIQDDIKAIIVDRFTSFSGFSICRQREELRFDGLVGYGSANRRRKREVTYTIFWQQVSEDEYCTFCDQVTELVRKAGLFDKERELPIKVQERLQAIRTRNQVSEQ